MATKRSKRPEWFTVEQANAMLPLVRAIVVDLAGLSREVIDRRHRLAHLLSGHESNNRDVYREELSQVEKDLEQDARQLREYVDELRHLGVEPVNGPEGMVTFPSQLDGRRVLLSWKLNEPEVMFWQEPEAGYRHRRPLATDMAAS
ncbi:MAG: DUF2203 domain-containing protein [Planctomycetaceae bacterium]|nr:DUF2203 domain-containing protein [Planctomycetaceae bacterium]